jgi:hypothetical protein
VQRIHQNPGICLRALVSIHLRERFGFDPPDGTQSEQQGDLKTAASPDVAAE